MTVRCRSRARPPGQPGGTGDMDFLSRFWRMLTSEAKQLELLSSNRNKSVSDGLALVGRGR